MAEVIRHLIERRAEFEEAAVSTGSTHETAWAFPHIASVLPAD